MVVDLAYYEDNLCGPVSHIRSTLGSFCYSAGNVQPARERAVGSASDAQVRPATNFTTFKRTSVPTMSF